MFSIFIIGVFLCLLGASFLDLKYRAIPSVFLTGLMFAVAIVRFEYLQYGILAGIFAWMMKDLIFEFNGLDFGVADIKIMIIIGLILSSRMEFLLMIGIFAVIQLAWVSLWSWKMKADKREMPFVPCLIAVYITMMLLRWFA